MSGPAITLERRRLNEEIEGTFINAARAASNVELKLFSGKGNPLTDLQDFYSGFNYLYRLTSSLPEMCPKEPDKDIDTLKRSVEDWMRNETGAMNADYIRVVSKDGLDLFDRYYRMLMHRGIISLPTRRG